MNTLVLEDCLETTDCACEQRNISAMTRSRTAKPECSAAVT